MSKTCSGKVTEEVKVYLSDTFLSAYRANRFWLKCSASSYLEPQVGIAEVFNLKKHNIMKSRNGVKKLRMF